MSKVTITVFTDPACPIALSAEPRRMRIAWLFREQLSWELRPVVLSDAPRDFAAPGEPGFTKERFLASLEGLVNEHHMPIAIEAARRRERVPVSIDACRAIVAAGVHGGANADWCMLQALREHYWTYGVALDSDEILERAAATAQIDVADLRAWVQSGDTDAALRDAMERARTPLAPARVLDYRLADASDGRRRYTCPTWELRTDAGAEFVVPGFVPVDVYETVLANIDPRLERRDDSGSIEELLEWVGRPIALAELAAIRGIGMPEVQRELAAAGIEATDWVRPMRQLVTS